jgi:hypothetical protein
MTVQISQRGKEYTTLFRAAKTMTDSAIAGVLRALAEDYQRRAEKTSDEIVNDTTRSDDMCDHVERISYSHWGMFRLG